MHEIVSNCDVRELLCSCGVNQLCDWGLGIDCYEFPSPMQFSNIWGV